MTFEVIPAIDLRGGRVVRLRRGDFGQETDYGEDPVAAAIQFANAGVTLVHLVDLDGARIGAPTQSAVIAGVVEAVHDRMACEVSGGLRTLDAAADAFAGGADAIVVGTAALRDSSFAGALIQEYGPDHITCAIDVRDGEAIGEGWRPDAPGRPVEEAIEVLAGAGVQRFEVTAINRDGLLDGPDLELLRRAVAVGAGEIVASGGVASLSDLRAVADVGCLGAIVGRALYEGRVDINEALSLARNLG